jgi:hypothetical protein
VAFFPNGRAFAVLFALFGVAAFLLSAWGPAHSDCVVGIWTTDGNETVMKLAK